ncbi:ATP-dependent Clp protease ATP-binding subunit ClpX [Ruegeria sp. TrichCH4B]|nr:ATP-dependent Clp protease ATP-binding subunit ClpX [Ruegeria sp. TrichCH4B]
MFELPGMESVTKVVVNEEAVTSEAQPLMIHADEKESATAG